MDTENTLEIVDGAALENLDSVIETVEGQVTVVIGQGGDTAVSVSGANTTVATVLEAAARRIDDTARLITVTTNADGSRDLRLNSGEVYLIRDGETVSGAGLGTSVRAGDAVVLGQKHDNG